MKNSNFYFLTFLIIGLFSFRNVIVSLRTETVKTEKYQHEYMYNEQGILESLLTTSNVEGNKKGTLHQKLVFDSLGLVSEIYVITRVEEKNGLVHCSDQMVRFDAEREIDSYRFSRNFKRVDGKRYDAEKGKYVKLR